MSNSFFKFKKFVVFQSQDVFKVSTESVLLGAWCDVDDATVRCLDVGCGTGILSLILIQKGVKSITALDIDPLAINQSKENFFIYNYNFTKDCDIKLMTIDFYEFASDISNHKTYDLIISNPPYFSSSLKSKDYRKNFQKHALYFSWNSFFESARKLLKENGRLVFVFPQEEEKKVLECLSIYNFFISKKAQVYFKPRSIHASRKLLTCKIKCDNFNVFSEKIFLYDENGKFSEDYIRYVKDFYLNF